MQNRQACYGITTHFLIGFEGLNLKVTPWGGAFMSVTVNLLKSPIMSSSQEAAAIDLLYGLGMFIKVASNKLYLWPQNSFNVIFDQRSFFFAVVNDDKVQRISYC